MLRNSSKAFAGELAGDALVAVGDGLLVWLGGAACDGAGALDEGAVEVGLEWPTVVLVLVGLGVEEGGAELSVAVGEADGSCDVEALGDGVGSDADEVVGDEVAVASLVVGVVGAVVVGEGVGVVEAGAAL